MPSKLHIPTYTSKDFIVMVASMLPFSVFMGHVLFGDQYYQHAGSFLLITLVLFAICGSTFFLYGIVALWLSRRLPHDRQIPKKLAISIGLFLLISVTFLNLLLRLLDSIALYGYSYRTEHFWNLFAVLGSLNILLTFVHECIAYFERYKATAIETETLKREYTRSRLLGLQSQVNPHFLFNNLNTLSSLIQEDNEKAEAYLDELSKVYRYLLRHNDAQLVTLDTELRYLQSYVYLLQQRHGSGLQLQVLVNEAQKTLHIPPLTLQMILENCMTNNSLSKSAPLVISICSEEDHWLKVHNNAQPRVGQDGANPDDSLDNIISKIHLLCREEVSIRSSATERVIFIPLITCLEEVAA
jgi:sensor histidine kinase YesM